MGLGSVPHRTLHLLSLIRAQKIRPCQRDVQFTSYCIRVRAPEHMHVDARARIATALPRNVHRALDDASERAVHRDRDEDVCGPLTIDVRRCARAALVL